MSHAFDRPAHGHRPWDNFAAYVVAMGANLWAFECIAELLSLLFQAMIGMPLHMVIWSASLLFNGITVQGPGLVLPLRILYHVLPGRYLVHAASWNVFMPTGYQGAVSCAAGVDVISTPSGPAYCPPSGFHCPNATSSLVCFGETGRQVLDSIHHNCNSISSDDERGHDLLMMLAFVLVFKAAYVALLVAKCQPVAIRPRATGGASSAWAQSRKQVGAATPP